MVKLDGALETLYYDPKGAREALGVTKERLDYLVELKVVKRVKLPGYQKKYFFLKTQIDALARQYAALALALAAGSLEYRFAGVEDVKAENDLALLVFGEKALNPKTQASRKRFIEVNPFVTHHLYDNGLLVASLNFVPITSEAIEEFKQGKRGWLLTNEQIEQFTNDHPLEAIIIDFMTNPTIPTFQRRLYGMHLLSGFAGQLEKWGKQGVEITRVYASGGTAEGRHLLHSAGFAFLYRREEDRDIHVLDITSSDLKLLHGYKRALAVYKVSQARKE